MLSDIHRSLCQLLADDAGIAGAEYALVFPLVIGIIHGIAASLMDCGRPRQPRCEAICVEDAIDAALARTAREIQQHGVTVARHHATAAYRVFADTGQLEQVFVSLFINACHAMPGGGTLTIDTGYLPCDDSHGELVVTVADTGGGIGVDDLAHVFEPCFTAKGGREESDVADRGLGLSDSRGIIVAHGGTITAHSEEGVGTTFQLRLTAYRAPSDAAAPGAAASRAPLVHRGAGRRVLLAEDEDDLREIVSDSLLERGYEVVATATTGEALSALDAGRFDIILSDVTMPGGGGEELVRVTRTHPHPPPIILVTGWGEGAITSGLLANGASACLYKPFSLTDLLDRIETVMAAPPGQCA